MDDGLVYYGKEKWEIMAVIDDDAAAVAAVGVAPVPMEIVEEMMTGVLVVVVVIDVHPAQASRTVLVATRCCGDIVVATTPAGVNADGVCVVGVVKMIRT